MNNDESQMEHLQLLLKYIDDKTVYLPKIDETFKADLTGYRERLGRGSAMDRCGRTGYHLLSDHQPARWLIADTYYWKNQPHLSDEGTDRNRFIDVFKKYKSSLADMVGMQEYYPNIPYWTASKSYDWTRDAPRAIVRCRDLTRETRIQSWMNINCCYISGFKNK